jgi:hypothetical protein
MKSPDQSLVKSLRAIATKLIMGVIVFGAVGAMMIDWKLVNASMSLLAIVAFAMLACALGMATFVPQLVLKKLAEISVKNGNAKSEPTSTSEAHRAVQTKTIVRYAILDMPALIGLVVMLMESNLLGLGVAVVVLAMMVAFFPTTSRMESDIQAFRDEVRNAS